MQLERLARAHHHRGGLVRCHRGALGLAGPQQRPGTVSAGERHELPLSHKQAQKIVPRPVPSHGYFLFLFFNVVIILFNWTSGSHSKFFLRKRLLQRNSNYRIITLLKDNNS